MAVTMPSTKLIFARLFEQSDSSNRQHSIPPALDLNTDECKFLREGGWANTTNTTTTKESVKEAILEEACCANEI